MKKDTAQAIATPPRGPPRARDASPSPAAEAGAPTLDVDIDVTADAVVALPPGAAGPASPAAAWPAIAASDGELEDQLVRGLAGLFDAGSPLALVTARVAQALSPIERSVLSGEAPGVDPAPLRSAALMRLRVAAALASAPPPGTPIDDAALSALLAEIDRLLSDVSGLAAGAAQPVQIAVDAVRSALVKEAIDLSEAAQAIAPRGAVLPAPVQRAAKPGGTRLLSVSSSDGSADEAPRSSRWLVLALGVTVALAASWHVTSYRARHVTVDPPPTVAGAPGRAFAVPVGEGGFVVQAANGKFTPGELEALRETQAAQGNTVEEVGPGVALVHPASAGTRGR